jgi:hypothetical protein
VELCRKGSGPKANLYLLFYDVLNVEIGFEKYLI